MQRVIDGRNMVPPEPLEHTLAALDELAPGEEVLLLLNCRPNPLFQILQRNGYVWREATRDDGTLEIYIGLRPKPGTP